LILWHGLADPHISPMNTVAYFEALKRHTGAEAVQQAARLYLFPGGDHCGGGEGPFDVDLMSAIMAWVEEGAAPFALVASHTARPQGPRAGPPAERPADTPSRSVSSALDRTRPVYPYPQVSRYAGHGSIDEAANFVPASAAPWKVNYGWLGSSFFEGSEHLWCEGGQGGLACRNAP
jgi:feruloyl esterase